MLNEWSDREPDPPPGFIAKLGMLLFYGVLAIVVIAIFA
jgi:hypothetical protein